MGKMTFIVYSQVNEQKISDNLGLPEYSYYFVLRGFLPVLNEMGRVVVVKNPENEVDAVYDECRSRGEDCIFMSFSPPSKAATGLCCPTLCVLAWEFDRIPDEVWDNNPKNDWRTVFADHGRTITLSQYSADAVKKAMGENFPVKAIPVPVWDTLDNYRNQLSTISAVNPRRLSIRGNIIDSSNYQITPDSFEIIDSFQGVRFKEWRDEKLYMGFTETDEHSVYLGGFYKPEPWGTWSRTENPWVMIPHKLIGDVHLKITFCGYEKNAYREIFVTLGGETKKVKLEGGFIDTELDFHLGKYENLLKFSGLDLSPVPGAGDPRSMGIGLKAIELTAGYNKSDTKQQPVLEDPLHEIFLDGVVYTSVLNPGDDRKNWIDMVKGFCLAFQEVTDATLVLKMTHHSVMPFWGKLLRLLQQMAPFKCRIVVLHGYLDDAQYEHLIAVTSFYVNTSRCEGLCLPLMEFMSCSKPAIAPCNTSLADYVDDSTTLIIDSGIEPGIWPHDNRLLFRALRYRIDWESLVRAYRQSYHIAKNEPVVYEKMAKAAERKMMEYSSNRAIRAQLETFLHIDG